MIGDPTTIPKGVEGTEDRPPGEWATLLWTTPWKSAAEGEWLKGALLPKLIDMDATRELMARNKFFRSGKRKEERVANRLANIESAFIQCIGEVQEEGDRCESCIKHHGPWVCASFLLFRWSKRTRVTNISIGQVFYTS